MGVGNYEGNKSHSWSCGGRGGRESGGDSKECSEEPDCPPSWEATGEPLEDGIVERGVENKPWLGSWLCGS